VGLGDNLMRTIILVGHAARGCIGEGLSRGGFFVLPAADAKTAAAILNAIRPDGFVIDLGDEQLGGEPLAEWLQTSQAWAHLPIVMTGARAGQRKRLARRGSVVEMFPASEEGPEAVVAAMHGLMDSAAASAEASWDATKQTDDVPRRDARARAEPEVGVSTRTLQRWIDADTSRRRRGERL